MIGRKAPRRRARPRAERKPLDPKAAAAFGAEVRGSFQAIGRFIFEFSQLEFTIRFVLANMLGLNAEYFDVVTGPYDFAELCRVTREVAYNKFPQKKEALKQLFDGCLRLNDDRVRVSHGTWTMGAGTRHVSRGSLKATYYYEKRQELNRLADDAQRLLQAVLHIGA